MDNPFVGTTSCHNILKFKHTFQGVLALKFRYYILGLPKFFHQHQRIRNLVKFCDKKNKGDGIFFSHGHFNEHL
jgi:hypothetical protein